MEYINILSATKIGAVEPINFNKAIMAKDDEGFVLSGSKMILSYLKDKIGNIPMLIDFSTIPSTFKNDKKLADFITIYDPSNTFVDIEELEAAYVRTYYSLKNNNRGLFYHPHFFDSPQTPKYYYSEGEEIDNADVPNTNPSTSESWHTISGYNKVYFKNNSFPLPYNIFKKRLEKALTKENCDDRNKILLTKYNRFFLRDTAINEKKCCLLSVPLIGYPGRENESNTFEGVGAIFVYFIKNKSDVAVDTNKIANDLWFLGLQITYNSMFQIAMEFWGKATKEAERSAKAAIISRNLSHNLGSHVMFYIKQKLESVSSIFKEGALKELIQSKSVEDLINRLNKPVFNYEMPFLVGLGRFINYLQERQDYIATVATNHIPYRATINFKDAIYDELKPEKRSERHHLDKDAKDRKPKNLLLDYIAYSEGITSSENIKLLFRKDEMEGDITKKDESYFDGSGKPEDVPMGLRNFNVSLPGGNLGRQAFFSIIENIIRNVAKHESKHLDNNKNITLYIDKLSASDIKDVKGYSWRTGEGIVDIFDEEKKLGINNSYKRFEKDLYFLGITVKLDITNEIENTIKKISEGLHQNYLTSEGQMDDNCKGLKEIRISAAWIRGAEMDNAIPDNEPPAVAIQKTDEGYLQYIICLPKPKKIAIVTNLVTIEEHQSDDFCYFTDEKFDFSDNYKNIANFDLIICDIRIDEKELRNKIIEELSDEIIEEKIEEKIKEKIKEIDNNYNKLRSKVGSRLFRWENKIKTIEDAIKDGTVYKEWICDAFNITNEDLPQISILDAKSCAESSLKIVKVSGTSDNNILNYKDCIVFNTHYPGQTKLEKKEDKDLFANACYVEAISGGNSTDRLIRREKRDWEWYAKHVAAGKAKVAIFDERLFEMMMPKDDVVTISEEEKLKIRKKVEDYCNQNKNATYSEKLKYLKNILNITDSNVAAEILRNSGNNENGFANPAELANRIINRILSQKHKEHRTNSDYSLAWKYREKGIWAYNIEQIDNTIQIIGYGAPVVDPIGEYKQDFHTEVIATIRKDNDGVRIVIGDNIGWKNRFDFIVIHQGILDKIYKVLSINKPQKKEVTKLLFDYFSKLSGVEVDKEMFLPQFIIHSGRSKPNSNDMPQQQPFLQFSALENAVRDCKYILTELLYSAHYE